MSTDKKTAKPISKPEQDTKLKNQTDQNNSGGESVSQPPLAEFIRNRRKKARNMMANGVNPYPYSFDRSHLVEQLLQDFDALAEKETVVSLAGRIMLKRKMGKSIFVDLHDSSNKLQLYIKLNNVGQELFDLFDSLDLGDIIGSSGTLFVTRMGERSLKVEAATLLTKSLHPLPDKHAGLTDVETRYRRRYADLIVNPEVRQTFVKRTAIIRAIRDFLNDADFLEVETPVLQPIYGGGMALPFKTHYNKLNRDMYLRIADELYLKRLIVGGYDKVWELCKDFRNEGIDRLHNPEFSMIEMYWAYVDYRAMGDLFETMLREVVLKTCGSYKIPYGDHEIDFAPPFRWLPMLEGIKEATGHDLTDMSFEDARAVAKTVGVEKEGLINWGKVVEAMYEAKVEPTLIQPTFVCDFPVEISPLAKRHRSNDRLTERFELFVATQEMGNAFSELNDPADQLARFMQQGKALAAGDKEAQPLDDDFITALTYGMPPTAGLGFGIDRLIMLLTNKHTIRDVVFFPQMKEEADATTPVSQILAKILDEEKSEVS